MKAVTKKILIAISLSIILIALLIFLTFKKLIIIKIDKYKSEYEVYEEISIPKAKVYFLNIYITNKLSIKSDIDTNKVGKYTVTYSVKYLFFNKKVEIELSVVDKVAPELKLNGDEEVRLCPHQEYEEIGYSAIDNYDKDITNEVSVKENNNSIEYSVVDSSNNKSTVIRHLIYEDIESPKIEIVGSKNYTINLNSSFNIPEYNVSDNCDSNIKDKVQIINEINTKQVGTYKVIYKVKDESNNEAIEEISVKVINPQTNNGYSDIVEGPTYIKGILIVNKKYSIPANYKSEMESEANAALNKLQEAAKNAGYSMPLLSGYRSYYTQRDLYNYYVSIDGVINADRYSARPGHSEHQTGLAFDVGKIDGAYGETPAGIWLSQNAHFYGFIIRYPKGKEYITGYMYEPWHIRYVGTTYSKQIYESGLTLEEYLGVY